MIFFHGLRLYRLAAAEADMSYTPPFGGAIFFSMVRMIELLRLCNLGGTIESLAPEVKDLTRTEMTELMEHIFSLPEVRRAVRHMAITHISQANRGKEQKADGNIPLHSHPDQTQ